MKDIKYFLDEEDEYNQTQSIDNIVWNGEAQESIYNHRPLGFLQQKPFHRTFEKSLYHIKERTQGYDLSEAEMVVLGMFIMHHSRYFRDDYYEAKIPEIALNMFEVLNSAISKAPKTDSRVLYRFCNSHDNQKMQIGDIIKIPHNLTCTPKDKWGSHEGIYIIQTLPKNITRAYDLYKMYSHNINEKQVNFLRGNKFYVTGIEKITGTPFHRFYMNEIDGENN